MKILLVHPHLDLWAGGEYITLLTAQGLLKAGHKVAIACEKFDVKGARKIWGLEKALEESAHVSLPKLPFPRFKSFQRLPFVHQVKRNLASLCPDMTMNMQQSTYLMPGGKTTHFMYHHGDLLYLGPMGYSRNSELYYHLVRSIRDLSFGKS